MNKLVYEPPESKNYIVYGMLLVGAFFLLKKLKPKERMVDK